MTTASTADYSAALIAVIDHVQTRYGVSIEVANIAPPLKGDLDGLKDSPVNGTSAPVFGLMSDS